MLTRLPTPRGPHKVTCCTCNTAALRAQDCEALTSRLLMLRIGVHTRSTLSQSCARDGGLAVFQATYSPWLECCTSRKPRQDRLQAQVTSKQTTGDDCFRPRATTALLAACPDATLHSAVRCASRMRAWCWQGPVQGYSKPRVERLVADLATRSLKRTERPYAPRASALINAQGCDMCTGSGWRADASDSTEDPQRVHVDIRQARKHLLFAIVSGGAQQHLGRAGLL